MAVGAFPSFKRLLAHSLKFENLFLRHGDSVGFRGGESSGPQQFSPLITLNFRCENLYCLMTLQENPSVIKELQPIVEHFVSKSAGYSVDTQAFEDAYSQGYTGMILNPENFEDKKAILTALIAKTKYELQASRNVRRSEDRFRAAMPTQTQEDGSWEFPEAPQTHRSSVSKFRDVPLEFVLTLPTRARTAVSLLRDGMTYQEAGELMGVSVEGLLTDVDSKWKKWSDRGIPYELTPEDLKILQHGKWRVPAVELTKMLLKQYASDVVAHRLKIPVRKVWDSKLIILRRLPHLRKYLQSA